MKILVLGVTGLIGSSVYKTLSSNSTFIVYGTCRNTDDKKYFSNFQKNNIFSDIHVSNFEVIKNLINKLSPDVVVNCIGITKHLIHLSNHIDTISINSLFPHQLAKICSQNGAKLIQVSTDCVFSGTVGNYSELDVPDAADLYGLTKILGEVTYDHHLTVRISTIGHELDTAYGLLNWFLSQENSCKGYSRAIFSGLPSIYFAQVLSELVLSSPNLKGLYHISSEAIDKFSLLNLIAREYGKAIDITDDQSVIIDRSLNGSKFSNVTGFVCPKWPELIKLMALTKQ